jgi:hypothetical protein
MLKEGIRRGEGALPGEREGWSGNNLGVRYGGFWRPDSFFRPYSNWPTGGTLFF